MNVSTLRLVLPTKFATSSSSIDLPVKSRTSLRHEAMNLDSLSTNNPFLTDMIGDFNAKSSKWYLFGNSALCRIFKNLILKFITPEPNRISSTQNFEGLKLLTRMRLGLSHLADHKFRHNFQDCSNPICSCGQEIETTSHFLLHCLNYCCARKTFFEKTDLIDSNILQQNDFSITKDLLFGSEKLKDDKNNALLMSTIEFIQSTKRFKYPLFKS